MHMQQPPHSSAATRADVAHATDYVPGDHDTAKWVECDDTESAVSFAFFTVAKSRIHDCHFVVSNSLTEDMVIFGNDHTVSHQLTVGDRLLPIDPEIHRLYFQLHTHQTAADAATSRSPHAALERLQLVNCPEHTFVRKPGSVRLFDGECEDMAIYNIHVHMPDSLHTVMQSAIRIDLFAKQRSSGKTFKKRIACPSSLRAGIRHIAYQTIKNKTVGMVSSFYS